jgi:hypothetical protein
MSEQPFDTEPLKPITENPDAPEGEYDYNYEQTEHRRGGCGCWITALTTLVVFGVLIVIGLFLPPVNLLQRLTNPQFTTLTSSVNAVADGGLTLTSYELQPGESLAVTLSNVPMNRFLAGDITAGTWIPDGGDRHQHRPAAGSRNRHLRHVRLGRGRTPLAVHSGSPGRGQNGRQRAASARPRRAVSGDPD